MSTDPLTPAPASCLEWARREPPRVLVGAPSPVTRYVKGTRVALRVVWGVGAFVAVAFAMTGQTLSEKLATLAGAALVIGAALWALSRSIAQGTERWLTDTRAEPWRVAGVEPITVRDARSARRVHEVTLAPRQGGAPLFVYLLEAPGVRAGHDVAVLPRGARALVMGLKDDEVLIAVAVPRHRT